MSGERVFPRWAASDDDRAADPRAFISPGKVTLTSRLMVQRRAAELPPLAPMASIPDSLPFCEVDPFGLHLVGAPSEPVQRMQIRAAVTADAPKEMDESRATLDLAAPARLTERQLATARARNVVHARRRRFDLAAFGGAAPDSDAFAEAVAAYQASTRGALAVDGIAGPQTCRHRGCAPPTTARAPSHESEADAAIEQTRGRRDRIGAAERASLSAVDSDKADAIEEHRDTLPVQARAAGPLALDPAQVRARAAAGVEGGGGAMPHARAIKASFGAHAPVVDTITAHIGGAAADAAADIGAEAYAMGNAVAFRSAPDLATAAHEAAHVVQQRAGVQLLGGVGVRGDRYEQNADEVAAAVVRGESAEQLLLPGATHTSHGAVQRKEPTRQPPAVDMPAMDLREAPPLVSEEYGAAANDAEHAQAIELMHRPPIELRISAEGQVTQARALMDEIKGYRPRLVQGIRDGVIKTDALATNQATISALGDLLGAAAGQSSSLSEFQAQYRRLLLDVARLQGKIGHLSATTPGLTDGAGLGSAQDLAKRARKVGGTEEGATHFQSMQVQHEMLAKASSDIGVTHSNYQAASHRVMAASAAITAGVRTAIADPVARGDLLNVTAALKTKVAEAIATGTAHMVLPEQTKIVGAVLDKVIDDIEAGPLREFEAATAEAAARSTHAAHTEQVAELRAALATLRAAALAYDQATRQLAVVKAQARVSSDMFSDSAEAHGDLEVAVLAQLFGEVEAATAQCAAVRDLASQEGDDEKYATEQRTAVKKPSGGPSLPYFEPVRTYTNATPSFTDPRSVGFTYDAAERHVLIFAEDVAGPAGVNVTVKAARMDLVQLEGTLQTFRDRVQAAIGLARDERVP